MLTNVIGGQNGARVAERKCGGLESHCPFGDAQVQILPLALRSPPSLHARLPRLLHLHGRGVVGASLGTVDPKTRVQIPAPALLAGIKMVSVEPFPTSLSTFISPP